MKLKHGKETFEVEVQRMGDDVLNVAFVDGSGFDAVSGWALDADHSRITLVDEDGAEEVYEGFTALKSIVLLHATDQDFWEGLRPVVALTRQVGN